MSDRGDSSLPLYSSVSDFVEASERITELRDEHFRTVLGLLLAMTDGLSRVVRIEPVLTLPSTHPARDTEWLLWEARCAIDEAVECPGDVEVYTKYNAEYDRVELYVQRRS